MIHFAYTNTQYLYLVIPSASTVTDMIVVLIRPGLNITHMTSMILLLTEYLQQWNSAITHNAKKRVSSKFIDKMDTLADVCMLYLMHIHDKSIVIQ